jgi:hypothetical protein
MVEHDGTVRRPRTWRAAAGVTAAAAALLVVGVVYVVVRLWQARPRLTEDTARSVIHTTLQREAREAFVVTGALDVTATARVRHTRRLLPGILDVNLGHVESTVRAPGRVSYGFPLSALHADSIHVTGDTVVMRVPAPQVYAIEPSLTELQVETETGWLRLSRDDQAEVQRRATSLLQSALRNQAQQHLNSSEQPRVNTAETLHELLLPAFTAAGIRNPVFQFIISDQLFYRAAGGRTRRDRRAARHSLLHTRANLGICSSAREL